MCRAVKPRSCETTPSGINVLEPGGALLFYCFPNFQLSAVKLSAVQSRQNGRSLFGGFHLDESKTLGTTGFAVGDDAYRCYGTVLAEKFTETVFVGLVADVSDIKFVGHPMALM